MESTIRLKYGLRCPRLLSKRAWSPISRISRLHLSSSNISPVRSIPSSESQLYTSYSKQYIHPQQLCRRNYSATSARHATRKPSRAFIALGSNMGNTLLNIEEACRQIDQLPTTKITQTSHLYKTKAMYVTDQADFLNGVCEIETGLDPIALLDRLQGIEMKLKRKKVIDKGPRSIDLDILLYDDVFFENERLCIPHKLMLERDFVLRPLCDLVPRESPPAQFAHGTFVSHLARLEQSQSSGDPRSSKALTFLDESFPLLASSSTSPLIMAILNLTPDSFSDGGRHSPTNRSYLQSTISKMLEEGASIIDIGGESTRPDSTPVSSSEELSRIMPAVEIASELCQGGKGLVSVDTYHADVADEALRSGAHIINDISAGALDKRMFSTITKQGASTILMHTRGTPQTMFKDPSLLQYGDDMVMTVASELHERISAAQQAGIRRWRITLDPGFGFAKEFDQNLELLLRFSELREHPKLEGFSWLVGVSRKKFVKTLAGYDPNVHVTEDSVRSLADAGTQMATRKLLQSDAEILRVHDVAQAMRLLRKSNSG